VRTGFREKRLQRRTALEQELVARWHRWTERAPRNRRRSGRTRGERGLQRQPRVQLETSRAKCSADTLRRALKRLGAVWKRQGRYWFAASGPLRASEERQAAMMPVPRLSPDAPERARKNREEKRGKRLRETLIMEFQRVLADPAVGRSVRWRLLRAAIEIAKEGTHSKRAKLWCDGIRTIPKGGGFSCEWAEQTNHVAAAALVLGSRQLCQVMPAKNNHHRQGNKIFDAAAPVPSAYERLAQGVLGGRLRDGWVEAVAAGARRCSEQMAAEIEGQPTVGKDKQQALNWLAREREQCAERVLTETLEKMHPVSVKRKERAVDRDSRRLADDSAESAAPESSGVDDELPW
jgi:hypothetical protein